ncbi:hypothetical protein [Saccharopolyspora shandongensis]|uniref:Uncharacterized protein n=1 Tax=Saccharopolyspora shandongensis TaxID=418495 RepID=A0A1H3P0T2_9PSEU|nr:hypothetical protein [Saccharopolyspora shandongensis]SDY94583.1 hypothetical protein SAMN05216215_104019 [Saccharopolyspora shandongensis]
MRIRTDDEIYRVDAVWLGPPKATFPWRARYVAWGVGLVVFLLVLAVERRMNIGFDFFSTAWAVIITIVLTRIICSRIGHERPLGAVLVMWLRELTAPREKTSGTGGAASAARIKVRTQRPRPKKSKRGRPVPPQQRPARPRQQPAARSTVPSRRTRSKEVRGVRSPARP